MELKLAQLVSTLIGRCQASAFKHLGREPMQPSDAENEQAEEPNVLKC